MPDISMCKHTTCPTRDTCYRNSASGTEPNPHRQSYGSFAPDPVTGRCDRYVKTPMGGSPPVNAAGENLYLIGASSPPVNGFR